MAGQEAGETERTQVGKAEGRAKQREPHQCLLLADTAGRQTDRTGSICRKAEGTVKEGGTPMWLCGLALVSGH